MPRPRRRDDVLEAASTRFFREGIAATGVDTVVADAGVAKMTLYSNFGSKDELVVAYLEHRDRRFFEHLDEELAQRASPWDRSLAPVTLYRRHLDEEGFHGCAFNNAAAELPADHPGRDVVIRHKQRLLERWAELLAELGVGDPERLAHECLLTLEGAFTHVGLGFGSAVLDQAEAFIEARLAAASSAGQDSHEPSA